MLVRDDSKFIKYFFMLPSWFTYLFFVQRVRVGNNYNDFLDISIKRKRK